MNYKYGEKTYFLGIVKFFDKNKDFGFIASNSCGMSPIYYQEDFYINSGSFIEPNAAKEGAFVVFQVETQEKGRTRAVNVRYAKKCDEDRELSLKYYGSFEFTKIDDRKINIFNSMPKPRSMELNLVSKIIVSSNNRSPKTTLEHFSFYVSHYEEKFQANERYIFDRDYARSQKNDWDTFFSELTVEEKKEVLRRYPSVFRYFSYGDLNEFICGFIYDNAKKSRELLYIKRLSEIFPCGVKEKADSLIAQTADEILLSILDSFKTDSSTWRKIEERNKLSLKLRSYHKLSDKEWLDSQIDSYLKLTSQQFDDEREQVLYSIRRNKYYALLAEFNSSKDLKALIESYNALSSADKEDAEASILDIIADEISLTVQNRLFNKAVMIYAQCSSFNNNDFSNRLKSIASPYIKDYFCERSFDYKKSVIEDYFEQLKNCSILVEDKDMLKICEHCIDHLPKTESLHSFAKFIENISAFGESYNNQMSDDFSEVLKNQLILIANSSISSGYEFSQFFESYDHFKRYLRDDDRCLVVERINSLIANSNISILSILSEHDDFTSVLPAVFFHQE